MPPPAAPDLIATFNVPKAGEPLTIEFKRGSSIVLLGPNGAGKTRLSSAIEQAVGEKALRIGAHRSLTMNTNVTMTSLTVAMGRLRYGYAGENAVFAHRVSQR